MIDTARFAFGNARVRAKKSRLFRPEDAAALRAARATRGAFSRLFQELTGVDVDDPGEIFVALFRRLVTDYQTVLQSYPAGGSLFLALLRLHEVENLKLLWRASAHAHPAERWLPCWHPLGALEILKRDDWADARDLEEVVVLLRKTPYGDLAAASFRAHGADPAAAELAFDRWASTRLAEEAQALPEREGMARELVLALVRERDLDTVRRCARYYGLAPDLAIGVAVVLPSEMSRDTLRQLIDWNPTSGPLSARLPPRLLRDAGVLSDWNALRLALHKQRRKACLRAFMQHPFQLAPAVAFLLLREEEMRGLTALAEAGEEADVDELLSRTLAASMMGT